MQPGEALDVAAQVAVTLAGFAGIVVVFRPESVHQWAAIDKFRLRLLLANSALPLICSLFGILLLTVDPAPAAIWRWCSGFTLAVMMPFVAMNSMGIRDISRMEHKNVSSPLFYLVGALGTAALGLQLINAVVWNKFWPFFSAIFVYLVAAVVQFLRLLLLPPHRREKDLE
jgi:hypothetical protein